MGLEDDEESMSVHPLLPSDDVELCVAFGYDLPIGVVGIKCAIHAETRICLF